MAADYRDSGLSHEITSIAKLSSGSLNWFRPMNIRCVPVSIINFHEYPSSVITTVGVDLMRARASGAARITVVAAGAGQWNR